MLIVMCKQYLTYYNIHNVYPCITITPLITNSTLTQIQTELAHSCSSWPIIAVLLPY